MIRIYKYGQVADADIFARVVPAVNVETIVAQIIADVKANGDEALLRYCQKFDRAELTCLQVSQQEIEEAVASVDPAFITILEKAAVNIDFRPFCYILCRYDQKEGRTCKVANLSKAISS